MWLIENSVRKLLEQAHANGVVPTAVQQSAFESRFLSLDDGGSTTNRLLTIADDKAEIAIEGILTKAPDFFAFLFGGGNTTYTEIISALAEVAQNDNVKEVVLAIDSPGGTVAGLFDTLNAIDSFDKPLKAKVADLAASAAFAIAARADSIEVGNRATRIGSVGVAVSFFVDDREVDIASTEAPKKRPNVETEEGKAIVREELDAIHQLFAEAIASGRNTTVENVNSRFGQGAILLAEAALERGMIDSIAPTSLSIVGSDSTNSNSAASGKDQLETTTMDIQKLKSEHPDTYAAAVKAGVDQERDRVCAHMTMGEASGDMKTAQAAITDGSEVTATLQAKYMSAGMNKASATDRDEDEEAAAAAAAAAAADEKTDMGDTVAGILDKRIGAPAEAA